jgi:hypothetical protein
MEKGSSSNSTKSLNEITHHELELSGLSDRRVRVSLCPRGLPFISIGGLDNRFDLNDESSWEREKKSSSPSYGDIPEFICAMPRNQLEHRWMD